MDKKFQYLATAKHNWVKTMCHISWDILCETCAYFLGYIVRTMCHISWDVLCEQCAIFLGIYCVNHVPYFLGYTARTMCNFLEYTVRTMCKFIGTYCANHVPYFLGYTVRTMRHISWDILCEPCANFLGYTAWTMCIFLGIYWGLVLFPTAYSHYLSSLETRPCNGNISFIFSDTSVCTLFDA